RDQGYFGCRQRGEPGVARPRGISSNCTAANTSSPLRCITGGALPSPVLADTSPVLSRFPARLRDSGPARTCHPILVRSAAAIGNGPFAPRNTWKADKSFVWRV